MSDLMLLGMELLAQDEPRQTGPDFGKASPVGLIIVVLLLVAVFGLVWSMNRHLRKLPESFDREHPEPDQAADEGTADGEGDAVNTTPDDHQGQTREQGGG